MSAAQNALRSQGLVIIANPAGSNRRSWPSPDELFDSVDGRQLTVGGRTWAVEVFGIRDVGSYRWVQVGLSCDGERLMITRRMKAGAGPQHLLLTLSSWLAQPAAREPLAGGVLNVA